MIAQPDTSRPLPQPERHWCPGCWAEMSAGSTGKCAACVGSSDSVWLGGTVHFFHDHMRAPPPMSDYRYHGRTDDEP